MKNYLTFLLLIVALLLSSCNQGVKNSEEDYSIIPRPNNLAILPGAFTINKETRILVNSDIEEVRLAADFLLAMLGNALGSEPEVETQAVSKKGSILLMITDDVDLNDEGYLLQVKPSRILLKARDGRGLFYGVQTLRQLLPPAIEKGMEIGQELKVPACTISDEPRFVYRGMHLDVGRHMFPVEYIKRYIDMLALHKMNTFHWHLTEDQGWRIEIEKYPLLTEIGAYRKETLIGHGGRPPFEYDGKRYGGYYSKEEVREIVDYAAERFVTVIPEIEMPGHALAALAAYPELSCTGGPHEVATRWGVFPDVFCAGKEETFLFLENVLSEVIELFPGKYIHIGGDECPKERWQECPECQKRIADEGLADEHELQSYFIKRIEKFLVANNRKLIGWDEILEGGLAPEATVMSWRGTEGGIAAAKEGHDVIMTPNPFMYLDHYQCEPEGEPLAIGGYSPLEEVYSYDPMPAELDEDEQRYILGVQGNLWSEYLTTPDYMEYMAYPRFFAVGEIGWTNQGLRDFENFLTRFRKQAERYDIIGINYFKGEYYDTRKRAEKATD